VTVHASAEYDLTSDSYFADPYPALARLRAEHPVMFHPAFGMWLLARYEDNRTLLRDPRFSAKRIGEMVGLAEMPEPLMDKAQAVYDFFARWLMFLDQPEHTVPRKLVAYAFSAKNIAALDGYVHRAVAEALDAVQGSGGFDVIRALAFPVPARVIAHMLGVPPQDSGMFEEWIHDIFLIPGFVGDRGENMARGHDGLVNLHAFCRELIARHRAEPEDNVLGALLRAEADGHRLTEDQVIATCALLILAGHETTTNLIGNGVVALLRNPDQLARLRAEPELIGSAVEEFNRYDCPAGLFVRKAAADIEIGGQKIRAGQVVGGLQWAAQRDPEIFKDPDRLDIARQTNPHLGFGHGIHTCVGAALARLETRVAISALIERFPRLDLADDELPWISSMTLRGVAKLPVVV
jgi:cytochrome P450